MQNRHLNPCVRFANIVSLKLDYPRPLLAYDHRLLYLLDGRMRIEFPAEERTEAMEAGDLLIWPPGVPYRFTFPPEENRHYVLMNFDFDESGWGSRAAIRWRNASMTNHRCSHLPRPRPSAESAA